MSRIYRSSEIRTPVGCESCAITVAFSRRVGLDWRCVDCGKLHAAPALHLAARQPEPAVDLDNLETWWGLIDGEGQCIESIYEVAPQPSASKANGHRRRGRQYSYEETRDAGLTARNRSGHAPSNQEPELEKFHESIANAVRTLRRIETLLETPQGRRDAMVLMAAYLVTGEDTRAYWKTRAGLDAWVGLVCAPVETRWSWLTAANADGVYKPEFGANLARCYGRNLLEPARKAYLQLPASADRAKPGRIRPNLQALRAHLYEAVGAAWQDVRRADVLVLQQQAQQAA